MKTLVLYVFHEVTSLVRHFIQHAVFQDDTVDFLFICNGLSLEVEVPSYVNVLRRENKGHDFGGWSDALLSNDSIMNYDTFIFVNSTAYGPFLPKDTTKKWTDYYIEGLTDTVKLFGSTINTCYSPTMASHIQSYIFSMNRDTLDYLIQCGIFTKDIYTKDELITKMEIGMSRRIIEQGWNIGCLHTHYRGIDWTFKEKLPHEYGIMYFDDIMYREYMDNYWTKDELLFIKGNRIPI